MKTENTEPITVSTVVQAPLEKVWRYWTEPVHITQWYQASSDWHAPFAENDVREGGKFKTTMAAKDGSYQFDFEGVYTEVQHEGFLAFTMPDGRKVKVEFALKDDDVEVVETFDAESSHTLEQQRQGWKNILDSFKKYTESH